jgi:hypothetical protein
LRVDRDWPVRLLFNESVTLEHAGARLRLSACTASATPTPTTSYSPPCRPARPARSPWRWHTRRANRSLLRGKADVVFTGHTHGGQVCLPGGWPPITHDLLTRRFSSGLHRFEGNFWLSVSRGCGFSKYPIRLFCPAEVIELLLQ